MPVRRGRESHYQSNVVYRDSFRVAIRSLRGVAQARAPAPRDWCCCMCVYLAACCIYEESDDEGEDKKPLDADFDVEAARCRKL